MMQYPLSDDTWSSSEYKAIEDVLKSGRFTMGVNVREFEDVFAKYFGSKHAVMVNSGSSANLLAIAALFYRGDLKQGDEIIVPAVSWSTTYYPLFQYGLKLKFIDIDIETLNIDIEKVKSAVTVHTKAIFAVNLLGNPNKFAELFEICEKNNILLIEDNCESMGAKYENNYTGTFGVLGTFSTFYSHHLCTMEGGVICTNDEELYHYLLSLRAHGWTRELPEANKISNKDSSSFYESFNFILPGYNLRPLELEGAIGIQQLKKLPDIIENRRSNASFFVELYGSNPNIQIQKEIGLSSWFGFSIILKKDLMNKRDYVIDEFRKKGIEVRPIVAGNFTKNKVIKYFNYEIFDTLTNADYLHENGFFLGNHSKIIHDKIRYAYEILFS